MQPTPTRAEIPEEVARSIVATNIGQVATALPDGKVLVTGGVGEGLVAADATFVGDPATGRWEPVGPMHTSRVLHTATALSDGSVLIAGGVSDFESTAAAEVFNPDTKTWTRVGDLAGPVGGHTAVLLSDGRVLVSGGRSTGATRESGQQVYDPETESWTEPPHSPRDAAAIPLLCSKMAG